MKTISFELSQKLNELGLLDNIETEFCYFEGKYIAGDNKEYICDKLQITPYFNGMQEIINQEYKLDFDDFTITIFKTLTTEEAIEFLPLQIYNNIDDDGTYAQLRLNVNPVGALPYYFSYYDIEAELDMGPCDEFEDVMGALEKMLNWLIEEKYLLDNNLLTK